MGVRRLTPLRQEGINQHRAAAEERFGLRHELGGIPRIALPSMPQYHLDSTFRRPR